MGTTPNRWKLMKRVQEHRRVRKPRDEPPGVLPIDPRDPDVLRVKERERALTIERPEDSHPAA